MITLVREAIANNLGLQTAIMSDLLKFEIRLGERYRSPFRKDINPGCTVVFENGFLLWKDYASDYYGDVINIAKFVHKFKFLNDAASFLYDVYKLFNVQTVSNKAKKIEKLPIKVENELYEDIGDPNYFSFYGITIDTLKKFDVFAVKTTNFNSATYVFKANSPIYLYLIKDLSGAHKGIKIYRPGAHGAEKWFTNTDAPFINGFTMTEYTQATLIFITSSQKDRMVLYECGYVSIAPQSENIKLDIYFLQLKFINAKFVVFFDNDDAGIKAASYYLNVYGLSSITIPKQETDNPFDIIKDPSDYARVFGIQKLKDFIDVRYKKSN